MKNFLLLFSLIISPLLTAQSWTAVSSIPAGVHHPVTWAINGQGYAVTGTNNQNSPTKDFHRYDPATDSWTTLADFPGSPRSFAIGVAHKGIGYLGFGASTTSNLRDLWKYDPVADQWSILAPCPCQGRLHPSFVAVNDAIYVGLGGGQGGDLKDWWKYDINSNSWSQLPDLPGPARHHPYQFVVNNQVYAGLGHQGRNIYRDWYKLDPATDSWQKMSNFPGEGRVAGTQLNHAGKGYVLSGDGDNHDFMATGEFWEYDHISDSWTQMPPHPGRSRWAPGNFVINDEVYFFGGLDRGSNQLTRQAYKYTLPSTVGLQDDLSGIIEVYPNPASHAVTIERHQDWEELQLINATGQLVRTETVTETLDISALPAGVYYLRLIGSGGQFHTQRLLVE